MCDKIIVNIGISNRQVLGKIVPCTVITYALNYCVSDCTYGGIMLLKWKNKIIGCILALTVLSGGNIMAKAVNDKPTAQTTQYAHELDAQAYSGNDLGAVYTKEATTFKVWAPTAARVAVRLYTTGSSSEAGAQEISTTAMTKGDKGVWSVKLDGDKKNLYYTYLVTIDGVTRETADVYAKAAGVNGNRSMVVDLDSTDPQGWENDRHVLYNDPTDAIVWEVHVKDFSNSEVSGVSLKYKGKYLAFTENGTTLGDKGEYSTCIDYLKKLGVTHVQLLPVYDYATVDESKTDSDEFNWGYDPKNYNVPEGSYSTDPFNGNTRITEFKQMIMALHNAGIGVIMDVVYNHTFTAPGGWFEMTVPGYYYRMKADGGFSDGSGCGNETASDHLMYRKYMIDSILYWTNEYHIDGFRFDLMGVHDVTTMNEIRKALDTNVPDGSKIIMYGEPWTGGDTSTKAVTATKSNVNLLDNRVGAFNDMFRDAVKGHVFNAKEKGFVQTGSGKGNIMAGITANCLNDQFNQPSQTVSYTSAHDNFTLYDKLLLSVKDDKSYNDRDEQLVEMNKLSAALILTSQGISFMQAGEEFARTKQGDENSYVSPASLNQLDWNRTVEYADLVSYYSGLIDIRRHFKPFRCADQTAAKLITFSDAPGGVVAYTLENTLTAGKEWSYAAVAFNGSNEEQKVTLKPAAGKTLPSKWSVIVNKSEAGLLELAVVDGNTITLPAKSSMMLVDKASFDKLAIASEQCTVRVEYKDSDTGEVISSRSYKGSSGSAFTTVKDESLAVDYDFDRIEGNEKGNFTKTVQTVTYFYKKFQGKIVSMKVNYLKPENPLIGDGDEEVEKSYTQRLREGDMYSANIKVVRGLTLDLEKFPSNALGEAGQEDFEVNYYYKNSEKTDLIIHYYNNEGWDEAGVYVYSEDDGEIKNYTDEDGMKMEKDSDLGDGWYTATVKDIGSFGNIYAVFSDTDSEYDSYFGEDGCAVKGEVWVKNGEVTKSGTVSVVCFDAEGKILKSETVTGKTGTQYSLTEPAFDGMKLDSSAGNTSGEFSDTPVYVVYRYVPQDQKQEEKTEGANPLPIVLGVTGGAAVIAAAALFIGYRKRKKRIVY